MTGTKCAKEENHENCTHTEEERLIKGTFTSVEIAEGLRQGFRLGKIFEAWHWEQRSKKLMEVQFCLVQIKFQNR